MRFLYETGSITEHTQVWWSVRPHLAFPTVEIRICDGQPDARRGAGRSPRSCYALTAPDRPRARRGRAAARPPAPAARGELLARDPLRPLRRADRPRRGRGAAGAGAPRAARRVGRARRRRARRRAVPRRPGANAAERQLARLEEGATLARDLRRAGRPGAVWLTSRSPSRTPEESSIERDQAAEGRRPPALHRHDARAARLRQARGVEPRPRAGAARDRRPPASSSRSSREHGPRPSSPATWGNGRRTSSSP